MMKTGIRLFGLVLLSILYGGTSSVFADDVASFNVATYNIRQQNEADSVNGDGWEVRCPVMAQLIRFHDFHIFGTQEGFKNQLDDLRALLPGYEYVGVAREDGKECGEHSAIFYDTAMFELLDKGDFWLSESPECPGIGWDAACTRICSWGKFRHKASGKDFMFYNLHLDHVGKVARTESVRLVGRKIRESDVDCPVFLTGDFNVDQNDSLYDVLSESCFFYDSFKRADFVYALNGTVNHYKTENYSDSRIDHIFVTDDVIVEKYGVLTDSYRTPAEEIREEHTDNFPSEISIKVYKCRLPSDHYPVKIKVKLS